MPGDLLHIDVKTYARFDAPGHALTGDRSRPGKEKHKHLGQDYAHAAVDDHSRLAFSELYGDERSPSVLQFLEHALAFYAHHGIVVRAILTDNAWSYTHNRALRELLSREGIQHRTIRPPIDHRPTARLSASTRRWRGSGATASATPAQPTELVRCPLAGAVQPAQATLGDRQPAADQPRSQSMWAEQRGTVMRVRCVDTVKREPHRVIFTAETAAGGPAVTWVPGIAETPIGWMRLCGRERS